MNSYIVELLKTSERVIIPDLGAFMRKKDTDVIYFNEYLKFNDGLITKYIIEKEGLEKQIAEDKIKEFVADIKAKLEQDKQYAIESVGIIAKTEKGKLSFAQEGVVPKETLIEPAKEKPEEKAKEEVKKEPKKKEEKPVEKTKDKEAAIVIEEKAKEEVKKEPKKKKKDKQKEKPTKEVKKEEPKTPKATKKISLDEIPIPEIKTEKKKEPKPEKKEDKKDNNAKAPVTITKISLDDIPLPNKEMEEKRLAQKSKGTAGAVKKSKPTKTKKVKASKPKKEKVKKEGKKKSKAWLWIIIIVVVVIGGAIGFAFLKPDIVCKYVNLPMIGCDKIITEEIDIIEEEAVEEAEIINDIEEVEIVEPDTSAIDTTLEDIEEEIIEEVAEETVEEEEIIEEVIEEATIETTTPSGKKYYVIAGCFSSEANADKLVKKLQDEGNTNAQRIGKIGRLYAVCFDFYDSSKEANNAKSKFSDKAWIKYK